MYVYDSDKTSVSGIKMKSYVKYLVIDICKSVSENFQSKLDKPIKIHDCWLQRDLTIYGRVLLTKSEGISCLLYPALVIC